MKNKRVLITCGPTWEAVDPMRVLSNRSTGELGQRLAKGFHGTGAKVTLLEGPVADPLKNTGFRIEKFCFYDELRDLLKKHLAQNYDCVVHAAAVSDYRIKTKRRTKTDSGQKDLTLKLVPNPKLINMIKRRRPETFLIGFKLESGGKRALIGRAARLFETARCDMVVANTLEKGYRAWILSPGKVLGEASSRETLTKKIIQYTRDHL